ncbi:MAG: hypothetical protein E7662_01505 [Ruminococcaceae bacterium]|nr:hypothetical protein [Oscillospiraceae bacterium]
MKWGMRIFAAAVIAVLFVMPIRADDGIVSEFEEEIEQFREGLPEKMPDALRDALSDPEAATNLGDALTFSALWEVIAASVKELLPSSAALMIRLMGILLCCGLMSAGKNTLGLGGTVNAWEVCCGLCLSLGTADSLRGILTRCEEYIRALTDLVSGVTPIACALTAASGNLNGAAVNRAALMLLYTLFQNLYSVLLLPAIRISFSIALVSTLGGVLRLDAIGRCVRRLFTWFIALLGVILSFVIGVQNVIARSADSFSMRTVKFALGSFIPLVGGALSDALGTAVSSLQLIRSTCGVVCAAAVLLLALPIILQLILQRAVFSLCQGAAELTGCDREGKLFGEMHGILGNMLALAAIVSLLFLFVLTLMTTLHGAGG